MSDLTSFQNSFEICPIFLNAGIANGLTNNQMPITTLTEPDGTAGLNYDDFFAVFIPLPGGTLAEWQYAEYPFASMEVAANAAILMPLHISMLMICPAKTDPQNNYLTKMNRLTSIQNQIQNHISLGGYFTVNTPGFPYQNVLLTAIRDVTPLSDKQKQTRFQWDFIQPLISTQTASQSLNNVMSGAQNGLPTPTTWNNTPRPNS